MELKRNKADKWISQADYLQGELISEVKHEYIDGSVYAMSVEDIYFRVDYDDVKFLAHEANCVTPHKILRNSMVHFLML